MTILATKASQQRPFLQETVLPTVPKLPTTNRLFSVTKKRPSLAVIALNRIGYGLRPDDAVRFEALGNSSTEQLAAYVEQQLNPAYLDDADFEARLAAANFSTLNQSREQLLAKHDQVDHAYMQRTLGLRELERLIFLRAIYSTRQLTELLADFWHNHFNIYAWQSSEMAATFMAYDQHVIRANLLGNYMQMVEAITGSPEWQENAKFTGGTAVSGTQHTLEETAYRICLKLCRRLISDFPPSPIVQSTTALFLTQKHAHDQLKQVVRHILLSKAFQLTWGDKVKRPFESIVSALRATNANLTIRYNDAESDSFMWHYNQIGQAPFACHEPDGYPDVKAHWQNSKSMIMRWRMINWLFDMRDKNGRFRIDIISQTPSQIPFTPNNLVDYWIERILGYEMTPNDRQILVNFLANDAHPDTILNPANPGTKNRLRETVALLLNTPQFQLR
ncbi:MAG: DUF1800 family protein [Anaerolineales bacterium]|nr:DUF1800 family protein [Anaerolineales bacterium]MCA9928010.1 DUF1800 family protein [Anaerolineales bacterium]